MDKLKNIKSWKELKSVIDNETNKTIKGDIFEALTKYYLLIEPIYQTQLKNVWIHHEVPSDIREYLNLPNTDEGIDLIAQTKDDKYWAIQCKYLANESSSINEKYISTFLNVSTNVCDNISVKLTTTTANNKSYKFDEKYDESVTFLLGDIWSALDEEFFKNLNLYLEHKKIIPQPFKPKPHQERAIANASIYFLDESNDRGKLIMACGSGKSLTAYWIAEKLESKNILIAVPSLALVKQTLEVWSRESIANDIGINWIAVCSDESVSKDNEESDIFISSTKDLGIEVSTKVDDISDWLKNTKHEKTIVFTTYQSGKTVAEASKKANFTFDIGIMDEAHKTVGNKNNLFTHLLFEENINIKKRLFMTATERMYRANIDKDEIVSMDDIELYGEDFEVLTFKEAIEMQPPILCDYKVVAMVVTKKEIEQLIEKNNYINVEEGQETKQETSNLIASAIVLHKAIKKYNIKHTISFHATVKKSQYFKEKEKYFRTWFDNPIDLSTYHVSGRTPTNTRNRIINDFSTSTNALITNARCLTEGVDVPNIDCVMFSDPRQSTVDIVQAVGRAIRSSANKKFGYVLVPIVIDENEDLNNIKTKSYQSIINILRSLSSNDDRIFDYLQTVDSGGLSNGGGFINIDVPVGLNIDIKDFTESIRVKVLEKTKKLKYRPFEESREFVRSLKLKNTSEWRPYCQGKLKSYKPKPFDIPNTPSKIYANLGWKNLPDWIGARNDVKYLPFEEAREFVRGLGLTNEKEWSEYCKNNTLPDAIPKRPKSVYSRNYKKRFLWNDFLGVSIMSFEEARAFAISLSLQGTTNEELKKQWRLYWNGEIEGLAKKPNNLPIDVEGRYKYKGWKDWNDWLTGETKQKRPFKEAREFVRKLNLSCQQDWYKYYKGELDIYPMLPKDIPTSPQEAYKEEYKGIADWLGYEEKRHRPNNGWMAYEEAKNFVRSLNLKSSSEWMAYIKGERNDLPKKHVDIPEQPNITYKSVDFSWSDWLGVNIRRRKKSENILSFEEARTLLHSKKFQSEREYKDWKEVKNITNLPANLTPQYKRHKDWKGVADFLGKTLDK
jgi:superfamily II DNA or RNA helicase